MSLISSLYTVISVFLFVCSSIASSHAHLHAHRHVHHKSSAQSYSSTSKSNVALYWGQGAGQQRLLHYCSQTTVDIIPIGFVNVFPAQGNGFPGDNFGNQCWRPPYVYVGPGNNPNLNQLQSECPQVAADIPVCQSTYGKKIILSLGGSTATYQLTSAAEGVAFADFLWGAFGPQTATWLASGLPRPFDGPNNAAVEVDGFDFDIEYASTDNSAGYIAMIQRLRVLFKSAKKTYLITGAPQCVVPDTNMATMIAEAQFDIIWVQYYNTPQCSARNWANANPNYGSTGIELASGFGYNAWSKFLVGTASANAKLYIGVPGVNLAKAYFCQPNFGGVMIWEATVAEANPSGPYYSTVKNILAGYQNSLCSTVTSSKTSSKASTLSTSTKSVPKSSIKTTSTSIRKSSTSSLRSSSTLKTILTSSHISKSPSKTTSSSSKAPSSTIVIPAGACGPQYGVKCAPSFCCSQYGYCGNTIAFCGTGCQIGFGICLNGNI